MDHPVLTALVLAVGMVLAVVAQWRGWRPSVRAALFTGIALRLVLLAFAATDSWQPVDFVDSFKPAGEAILARVDPVLPPREGWHFLPMSAYAYAIALLTGLPWEIGGRLYPMIADVILIVLVGRLAGGERAALARFQYACAPLALMVSTIHAQLESVSLVFLVGAYLAARRPNAIAAGVLFGFALSAKSWPIILLPVVLSMLPTWRRRIHAFVAAGAVPLLFFVTLPLGANTPIARMSEVIRVIGGVRPIVGEWGWTAILTGGNWSLEPTYARVGQIILYATLGVVVWLWRRGDRVDMTSAMLLAFMVVTPRLGAQYLLWFVPFLIARPTRWSQPAMTVAALWAGIGYIYLTQFDETQWWLNHTWWAMSSVAVIPFLIAAMPWARRGRAEVPALQPVRPRELVGVD